MKRTTSLICFMLLTITPTLNASAQNLSEKARRMDSFARTFGRQYMRAANMIQDISSQGSNIGQASTIDFAASTAKGYYNNASYLSDMIEIHGESTEADVEDLVMRKIGNKAKNRTVIENEVRALRTVLSNSNSSDMESATEHLIQTLISDMERYKKFLPQIRDL